MRAVEETWFDFEGNPLKFQYGDRVKINRSPGYPGRTDGWVRGFDLFREGDSGPGEAAYHIYFLGDPPQTIRESALERQPEYMQRDHEHTPGVCGICGHGG